MSEIIFDFRFVESIHWIIVLVGYLVVFMALAVLVYIFVYIPRIMEFVKNRKQPKPVTPVGSEKKGNSDISGEVNAAISTALFLYFNELHDEEDRVVTIKKVSKTYSPWSSKIYGLNNMYYSKKK